LTHAGERPLHGSRKVPKFSFLRRVSVWGSLRGAPPLRPPVVRRWKKSLPPEKNKKLQGPPPQPIVRRTITNGPAVSGPPSREKRPGIPPEKRFFLPRGVLKRAFGPGSRPPRSAPATKPLVPMFLAFKRSEGLTRNQTCRAFPNPPERNLPLRGRKLLPRKVFPLESRAPPFFSPRPLGQGKSKWDRHFFHFGNRGCPPPLFRSGLQYGWGR